MSYKIGYVFLICQWLWPWKTSFWLSNERLKNINVAEQDKKKEPYSKSISHSLHILLFVWCRYWVSSEKSGLRSPRMEASVCWSGIGMLYGTNASGLAWTSQQYHFTLSLSPALFLYVSLSNKFFAHHLYHNHNSVEEEVWIRPKRGVMSPKPWLPASHARSTMEIKSVKGRKGEKNHKKTTSTSLHTPFTSILYMRLTWKRISEKMSRSNKKEIGKDRQLSLLCLACHTTMCMVDN